MAKSYRRFSREFKLQLVEAYFAGEGSLKGLARGAGIDHSLLHYWLGKYRVGELTLDIAREETMHDAEQNIAALERKVGQLTMELDPHKKRGSTPSLRGTMRACQSSPGRRRPDRPRVSHDRLAA